MDKQEFYQTIEQPAVAEFKDRGSKFLAYAYPISSVDEFKKHLKTLKLEHPKANHHCFAYRLGLTGDNFRSSDAGEPAGTAGRPILGQIDSKGLTNALIVVVRYFGGTMLGVPGLINAYKTAASLSLQTTPVVQKAVEVNYRFHFNYTQMNDVMLIVKFYNCTIQKQESQLFSMIELGIPKNRLTEVLYKIKDLQTVEVLAL